VVAEVETAADPEVVPGVVLAEAPVAEVLISHSDLSPQILTIQRTTTMALKNETKSSEIRKGQSSQSKKVVKTGKKAEAVLGVEDHLIEEDVDQIAEGEAVVAEGADEAGIRIVLAHLLLLILRTETSR